MLVDQFVAQFQRFGFQARFGMDPPRAGRCPRLGRMARKWCQQMRRKWGLRRGHLQEGELLTREEVIQKVLCRGMRCEKHVSASVFLGVLALCLKAPKLKIGTNFEANFGVEF